MMELVWEGQPVTKKNSMRLVCVHGRMIPLPSKQFKEYEHACLRQILGWQKCGINYPVNIKCVYYMATKRKVDLLNLLGATMDILVDAGVLLDDNSQIAVGHDGSRVNYDRNRPRVEIKITEERTHVQGETEKEHKHGRTDADAGERDDQ